MSTDVHTLLLAVTKAVKAHPRLTAGVGVVIISFLMAFVLQSHIESQRTQQEENKIQIEEMSKLAPRLASIKIASQTMLAIKEKLAPRLFDFNQNTQILAWFLALETTSGARLNNPTVCERYNLSQKVSDRDLSSPTAPVSSDIYKITYELRATGEYAQLLHLVHALQHGEFLASIQELRIVKKEILTTNTSSEEELSYEQQLKKYKDLQTLQIVLKISLIGCFK